ncbi:EAL domain-containing protein [Magnetospirillum sp. UT-4]|uniref:EAL domain-containing protein n=1 Tax=Magnetospirillum sp. UT-4 TaxID=2681467 RepID=UPI00137D298E|nr:EAL domain-containing protein [Magnetospirillum sp. UT-4]CAA7624161.1 conserved hypothetical protein [Magnetospirillum sp. UT-4]
MGGDGAETIGYCAGAGEALHGVTDADMMGKPLAEFVYPRDRKRYDEALLRLRNTGRLDHTPLTLVGAAGTVSRMRLAGIRLPQYPNTYHLVLSRVPPIAVADADRVSGDESDPKAKFVEMVQSRLNEANRLGQDYLLTLFDLSGCRLEGIEPVLGQSFLATFYHAIEECSVRGASAAALSERTFGMVHDSSMSAEMMRKHLAGVIDRFGGTADASLLKIRSSTLDMEDSELSEEDIGKALSYIVNSFCRDSSGFVMKSLADGARLAIADTLVRVRNFRKMIKGDDKLVFWFQPIVNVRTGAVLKYEAFSRIIHNGAFFVPSQVIPFATDVGVIGEFDLAAVTKAIAMMKEPGTVSTLANIAVNISGHSLGNPGFYQALLKLLEANKQVLRRLILEITDATQIYNMDEAKRLLTRIRRLGPKISLDDFGSGGSAFDLLRNLPVDFAKFDHAYVIDAKDPKGRSVLKAMTGLCHDLNIVTVGECVEDAGTLKLLAEVGIDYAQGYYFGKPHPDAAKRVRYFTDQVREAGTIEDGVAMG